jgi:squalene-hopene/tetraprenyl-beta-curcumene cyclase
MTSRFGRTPGEHAEAVRARYGKDRTFSVPILMTCAVAGLVDWQEVPRLPFELACFPQSWFRFLHLPVVSYALPALIAIGQSVHQHRSGCNPLVHHLRNLATGKSMRVLQAIQPSNGGFLEATPLTSFVTLGLASSGRVEHQVVRQAVAFLKQSVRPDGSWPIDTNLATWVTTLAINALAAAGELKTLDRRTQLRDWLLSQQFHQRHPYTGADPGGWGWTDLPGSVPDADDTAGALLALHHLASVSPEDQDQVVEAIRLGTRWLLRLQNRDRGWPTFCRGWGYLPFDRSGSDLTAHVLKALHGWGFQFWRRLPFPGSWVKAIEGGEQYLRSQQRADGSWLPLWFGNQHAPNEENATYGTARVLAAYRDLGKMDSNPARRGLAWLVSAQNAEGGWGGAEGVPSSVEETALALEILLDAGPVGQDAVIKGLTWLVDQVEQGTWRCPTPMGYYFARLWYFEKLYPIIFTVAALGRARRSLPDIPRSTCAERR